MTRRIPTVVVVLGLLGAVAGCGGGDSSSPTAPTAVATAMELTVHALFTRR